MLTFKLVVLPALGYIARRTRQYDLRVPGCVSILEEEDVAASRGRCE